MLRPPRERPRQAGFSWRGTARVPIRMNRAYRFPYGSMRSAVYLTAVDPSGRNGPRDDARRLDPFDENAATNRPPREPGTS